MLCREAGRSLSQKRPQTHPRTRRTIGCAQTLRRQVRRVDRIVDSGHVGSHRGPRAHPDRSYPRRSDDCGFRLSTLHRPTLVIARHRSRNPQCAGISSGTRSPLRAHGGVCIEHAVLPKSRSAAAPATEASWDMFGVPKTILRRWTSTVAFT